MAVFHSMKYAALQNLLSLGQIVAGDLYYTTDTQQLYIACTTTNNGVGIAPTNQILTGAITLGFDGTVAFIGGAPVQGSPASGDTLVFNGTAWIPQAGVSNTFDEVGSGTQTEREIRVG